MPSKNKRALPAVGYLPPITRGERGPQIPIMGMATPAQHEARGLALTRAFADSGIPFKIGGTPFTAAQWRADTGTEIPLSMKQAAVLAERCGFMTAQEFIDAGYEWTAGLWALYRCLARQHRLREARGDGTQVKAAASAAQPAQQALAEQAPSAGGNRKLVWSIVLRSALWLVILAGLECAVGFCAWRWGEGENLWQKIIKSWEFVGVVFVICAVAYHFHLGRERRQLLKFWKGDDK